MYDPYVLLNPISVEINEIRMCHSIERIISLKVYEVIVLSFSSTNK